LTPLWRKKKTQETQIHFLAELLSAYSPSGKEQTVAEILRKEMSALGYNVKRDEVGNIIGEIGEGSLAILLCGHMDTVPGYIPVRMADGRLYGRGAVDAKGPLAALVLAAAQAAKEASGMKITVAAVVEEERKSKGIKHLIAQNLKVDYAIFGEPSGVENITIGYKGSLHLKFTLKTGTGHSAAPWLYDNAAEKAYELWLEIKRNHSKFVRPESQYNSVTLCLTRLSSGSRGASIVPSKCQMQVDMRIPPGLASTQLLEETEKVLACFKTANPKVDISFLVEDSNEPFEVEKHSPLVRAISYSIRKVRNKQPTLLRKTGTGDMNILGHTMRIPVVTYGPGNSHLDHTPKEHIMIKDYLDSIEIYKTALLRLNELHKNN